MHAFLFVICGFAAPFMAYTGGAPRHICESDPINNRNLQLGRIQWAAQCGYIAPGLVTNFSDAGIYPTFAQGSRWVVAPTSEKAACVPGLTLVELCHIQP